MSLTLGKVFDRSYHLRIPFLDSNYNIGVFFSKKSSFLLFDIKPDTSGELSYKRNVKVNMYKNLASSKFCETFLDLHNFKKDTLDIVNQFECVKPDYYHDVNFILNETLMLSKIDLEDRELFDKLTLYGFVLSAYSNEFIFLIAERQNIVRRLGRKIVRTTALQIATTPALSLLEDFHKESKTAGKEGTRVRIPSDEVIKLDKVEREEK